MTRNEHVPPRDYVRPTRRGSYAKHSDEFPVTAEPIVSAETAQHTPGPWSVGGPMATPAGTVSIDSPHGSSVAFVTVDDLDGSEGNVHLIAAAPDLLAALKEIMGVWRGSMSNAQTLAEIRTIVKAAIAKAEGR